MKIDIKRDSDTLVVIEGEIPADKFMSYWKHSLKELGGKIEIDGFRKGHIPENILIERLGEMHILEDMATHALEDAYPKIIIENKLDAVGRPEISITKIAKDNPLGFKINQAIMPEIKLPDYKKIAKEIFDEPKEDGTVTDKEIDDVVLHLRKGRAGKKEHEEVKEEELPVADDAFAKSLGDFPDINSLREKIRDNLSLEKRARATSKLRQKIIEAIIEKTSFSLPAILIDREVEALFNEAGADIASMGLKFEDYLKHLGKTETEFKEQYRPQAEKRAKSSIILSKIADEEKITADKKAVDAETERVLNYYQGADPHAARHYVEGVLKNEAVFKMLESSEEKTKE